MFFQFKKSFLITEVRHVHYRKFGKEADFCTSKINWFLEKQCEPESSDFWADVRQALLMARLLRLWKD